MLHPPFLFGMAYTIGIQDLIEIDLPWFSVVHYSSLFQYFFQSIMVPKFLVYLSIYAQYFLTRVSRQEFLIREYYIYSFAATVKIYYTILVDDVSW